MKRMFFRFAVQAVILGLIATIQSSVLAKDTAQEGDLFDMDLEELLQVEITVASKKPESTSEAPSIVVVVPKEEFELYGDRNLHQLMQRQPSVYTRGSYMYPDNLASFRGDMPTHLDLHTLILFNGRPIRESTFGGTNFPVYLAFPLESLSSVELVRGPGSALYGTNAFTGIVNLKSRSIPKQREGLISVRGGSHGYYDTTLSTAGRQGAVGYSVTGRIYGQDGYTYDLTDALGVRNQRNDRHRSVSGTTRLEYGGFSFDLFAVDIEAFHVGILPFWSVPGHTYGIKKCFANAGYRLPLHERMDLELNLTYNLQENRFAGFPTGRVGLNSSDLLTEATLFIDPLDDLNLILGYLWEYQMNYEGGGESTVAKYDLHPQSAYLQGDYRLSDAVKLIAGMQWNQSGHGFCDTVSRAGIIIQPGRQWGVKLLRGEAFRAPFALETDLFDLPVLVGNSALKPETITTYDAQLFYQSEKTYAALTYFHSAIQDLIIRDNSVTPTSFKNGGEQQFDGIEFEAKRFLTPHWHVLGSTMYQDNKQTADLNPSTAPHYMIKIGTGYKWNYGTASLFYSYFAKPPRLASEVVVNPEPGDLNLLSLDIQIDPSKWLDIPKGRAILTFRVENLFNEEIYVTEFNRGGNPNSLPDGPGRTFYIGFELHN